MITPRASTNQPAGAPAASPWPLWLSAARLLNVAALTFAVGILLTIVLLAKVPMMRQVIFANQPPDNDMGVNFTYFALLVAFAGPLAVLIYGLRHRWLSWRVVTAVWVLVIGTMAYLAYDDPVVILPISLEEFSPALKGDEVGYQLSTRFSGVKPDLKLDDKVTALVSNLSGKATDTDILRQHHDEIEVGWGNITVLRDWWGEMAALPRIGDLSRTNWDPNPAFTPIRAYSRYACAHAELLALDGKGDEALATLGQLADVSQKLSATSRSLVRIMIAIVVNKMAITDANYVLDHGTTSPAAREKLAATLAEGLSGEAGARRMIMVEYVRQLPMYSTFHLDDLYTLSKAAGASSDNDYSAQRSIWTHPLDLFDLLLTNPRATANLAGSYYSQAAELAAKRLGGLAVLGENFELSLESRSAIKNMGGRQLLSMAIPAYSKIISEYWKEQDMRAALLTRLKTIDAAK